MLLKNKGIRHIFYQEKDATKKKDSHLVALPFKVDGRSFSLNNHLSKKKLEIVLRQLQLLFYTFNSSKNFVASS